jgi:hypothetical protein
MRPAGALARAIHTCAPASEAVESTPAYVVVNRTDTRRVGTPGANSSHSRRLRSLVYAHNSSNVMHVGFAPAAPA